MMLATSRLFFKQEVRLVSTPALKLTEKKKMSCVLSQWWLSFLRWIPHGWDAHILLSFFNKIMSVKTFPQHFFLGRENHQLGEEECFNFFWWHVEVRTRALSSRFAVEQSECRFTDPIAHRVVGQFSTKHRLWFSVQSWHKKGVPFLEKRQLTFHNTTKNNEQQTFKNTTAHQGHVTWPHKTVIESGKPVSYAAKWQGKTFKTWRPWVIPAFSAHTAADTPKISQRNVHTKTHAQPHWRRQQRDTATTTKYICLSVQPKVQRLVLSSNKPKWKWKCFSSRSQARRDKTLQSSWNKNWKIPSGHRFGLQHADCECISCL